MVTRRAPDTKTISGLVESHYLEYRTDLVRFLARKSRLLPDEVSDLVHEVYIRLIRYWPEEAIRNPRAYLFQIARNVIRTRSHKVSAERGRCTTCSPEELEEHVRKHSLLWTPEEGGGEETARADIERVLEQLPPNWKIALVRQVQDGWTHQQIADELGISINTVKEYLAKALNHCRMYLSMPADRKRRGST